MTNTQQHIQALRSQLLEMSRMSQRAVDYSIKAYQLGSPTFCRHVRHNEHELGQLHCRLADRCRQLLSVGMPADLDSRFVWSTLRICGALHATYIAATEISRNTMLLLQSGQVQESLALEEMGQLVNRLVRLCTVALSKGEAQHAKEVLQSQGAGRWFDLATYQAHNDVDQWVGAQATFELATIKSLVQIAKQAHEIADAVIVWLKGKDCIDVTRESAAYVLREQLPRQEDEEGDQVVLSTPRCCAGEC